MRKGILTLSLCLVMLLSSVPFYDGVKAQEETSMEVLEAKDCGESFQIDGLVIKINDVEADVSDPLKLSNHINPRITLEMNFSQRNPEQTGFKEGDYFRFPLCTISGGTNLQIDNISKSKKLYHDGVYMADGSLEAEKDGTTGEVTLYYKVVFNNAIEEKNKISGTLEGRATIAGLEVGDVVRIDREGENVATFEKLKTPEGAGDPAGPPSGITIPEPGKAVTGYTDEEDAIIDWTVQLTDYAEQQFNNEGVEYKDLIFEEMLDAYQTFNTTSYTIQGLNVQITIPVYLNEGGSDDNIQYTAGVIVFTLGTKEDKQDNGMRWIDPSDPDAENYVKGNGKTWTIITEEDPDNKPKQRERLIVNFGAPKDDGLRYGDIDGGKKIKSILENLLREKENAQDVLERNPGDNPKEFLKDAYGKGYTRAQWERAVSVYGNAFDYYEVYENEVLVGPYIYSMNAVVKTKVDREAAGTVGKVKNSYKVSGGWDEKTYSAVQDNFWAGTIMATAANGDAQIFKADSLYGNLAGDKTDDSPVEGFIPNVSFEVYKENEDGPLQFDFDAGKYVYNENGTLGAVTTNDTDGSVIISGLPYGNYYLKEIQAPSGYYSGQNERVPFTVAGDRVEYKLVNNSARGVELVKTEEGNSEEKLAGVAFKLYTYTDDMEDATEVTGFTLIDMNEINHYVYDGSGGDELLTLTGGKLKIVQLPAGKYYLQESAPISGYQLSDEKYEFELKDELEGDAIVNLGNVENAKIPEFVEAGFEAKKELEGRSLKDKEFEFVAELISGTSANIIDFPDSNQIIASNDGEGKIVFPDMKYNAAGDYIYRISEVDKGEADITYDNIAYFALIKVDTNNAGVLVASTEYYRGYDEETGLLSDLITEISFLNKILEIDTVALDTKVINPDTGEEENGVRTPGVIQKGSPSEEEIIVDSLCYKGLRANTKYVIDGSLWHYTRSSDPDAGFIYYEYEDDGNGNDTGSGAVVKGVLKDQNGNPTYEFVTDETGTGMIQVVYSFNGKNLGLTPVHGSYLVAYEVIYEYDESKENKQGKEVVRHTDNTDADQTIHYIHGSGSRLYNTSYKVTKNWVDNNNAAGVRPTKIEVQLYRDGQIFTDTITTKGLQELNEENNWMYTWIDLPMYQDGTHTPSVYTVKEVVVPDHYEVEEGLDGTITNTYKPKDPEDPVKPSEPQKPQTPNTPKEPSKPTTTPTETVKSRTGTGDHNRIVLWSVLLVSSILVCGVIIHRKRKKIHK